MTEKWRDINGYDGVYQVSELGQVRNTQTNKILHPTKLKNGRIYVTLSSDGFQKKCSVHSLVAEAYLGECPVGNEIRHKDGDYTHNEFSNLEYITRQESQKQFVMATGGYSVNLTKRVQTTNGHGDVSGFVSRALKKSKVRKRRVADAFSLSLQSWLENRPPQTERRKTIRAVV